MTIITHPISEKKLSQQKEPLVNAEESNASSIAENDVEANRNPLIVTMMLRSRARRISSLTTLCVFLTALLVFTTGIIGGYYLYRQFTQYKLRHFRGWCSIPYSEQQRYESVEHLPPNEFPRYDKAMSEFMKSFSHTANKQTGDNKDSRPPHIDDFFDEEFDLDIEMEKYERIEVPNFNHGRRGRFVHDFSVVKSPTPYYCIYYETTDFLSQNKTAIIDLEEGRCFVMPLNRTTVLPPKSLYDLIVKMRTGYYNIDTEIVRESYRVVTPAVSDYRTVGYYIARECGNLPTYELEKVTSSVYKRSITEIAKMPIFSVFSGRKISEFHIVNLINAPGKK
ncbi:Integral membrane protein 2B-like protein [Dinothrombium tinctorium]|uniref:Integral membrane protein 2 n=1 Tax=Dinothrombium tinctorium TaxID=1965070 RepID=A0A3S3PFP7_9ACAR|nr:Integral membrane protein 2B-like protein [Dinothrombium tinctorium]RWS14291.1 Integral membrane protein 2B-like protein [Dinothrombium tinctorium]